MGSDASGESTLEYGINGSTSEPFSTKIVGRTSSINRETCRIDTNLGKGSRGGVERQGEVE